jgi:enoyl-CoA hydratase/carnithine racemase
VGTELPSELLGRGHVTVRREGRVVIVTLDRPDARNAQTPATWEALTAVGESCADGETDVVFFRGQGTAFSAGLDRRMFTPEGIPGEASLAELAALDDDAMAERIAEFQRAFLWQRESPALTVAAVHGPAIGAGFQLALACDILLATPSASFAMRETSYGLVPDLAGTQPLVRAVGYARAVELCATGRTLSSEEGFALGFVTRIVEDLDDAIADISGAVGNSPRGAVRDLMPLMASAEGAERTEQARIERLAQVGRLRSLLGGV